MKKLMMLLAGLAFCTGCYIRHPATGVRTLEPYEGYHEVCTTKVNKKGEIQRECRWQRSR